MTSVTNDHRPSRMTMYRLVIGAAGVALGLFGVYRLLTQIINPQLISIAEWVIGAIVLHDLILSPILVGLGVLLSFVPSRARTYLQGGLIAGGLFTSAGILFVVYVHTSLLDHQLGGGSNPLPRAALVTRRAKSILTQNYGLHLVILLAIIAGVSVLLYLRRVVLDQRTARAATSRPMPGPGAAE